MGGAGRLVPGAELDALHTRLRHLQGDRRATRGQDLAPGGVFWPKVRRKKIRTSNFRAALQGDHLRRLQCGRASAVGRQRRHRIANGENVNALLHKTSDVMFFNKEITVLQYYPQYCMQSHSLISFFCHFSSCLCVCR